MPEFRLITTRRWSSARPQPDTGVPSNHRMMPEFRQTTTRRRCSAKPPPYARILLDHHSMPKFRRTTTRRQSSAGPPPDAGVLPNHHPTPEFRWTTTQCRSSAKPPPNIFPPQHDIDRTLIPKLIEDYDNCMLTVIPDEDEIWDTINNMNSDSIAGPDGFTTNFCQQNWTIIKMDVIVVVIDFFRGTPYPILVVNIVRERTIIWYKPLPGWYKLNTDGSFNSQVAGCGGILRNTLGIVIRCFVGHVSVSNASIAELHALYYGINMYKKLGRFGIYYNNWYTQNFLKRDNYISCLWFWSLRYRRLQEGTDFVFGFLFLLYGIASDLTVIILICELCPRSHGCARDHQLIALLSSRDLEVPLKIL
ncbi:hypothetical protein M5K25_024332 [Dendrobium thyrsiflorum]|uniref:RNase H type-1 domain-containing protein n=1 Tax=Dendrobium thyrsiflorum TaxID=117978 RepID=A0ABD0U1M2_DENTH